MENPNRHAYYDAGAATIQMVLQAQSLGISAHQMAGFSMEAAKATLQIPADFDAVAAIAFGRQDALSSLPEALQERERAPRERKALETIAAEGIFPTSEKG